MQQHRRVWRLLLAQVGPPKCPQDVVAVDCVLYAFVRQAEPYLKQIYPQHLFDAHRRVTASSARVKRLDQRDTFRPRNDIAHDLKKLFTLRFTLPTVVLDMRKCLLAHMLLRLI